ncbi:hypothetical protein AB9N12_18575 [Bacteroides sp. AN502(2024)]|uniref:hypothetical protein n=1 Tax=Bacteroides sp. AN502(2024) TaxID=3160599 RepID=UPI003512E205
MKFIIILFLMLSAVLPSKADKYAEYFECADKENVPVMIDNLLSKGTRKYRLKEIRKRNKDSDHIAYYEYVGVNANLPDSVQLVVEINFLMKGANPDLGVTGTPVYRINSIIGEYLDLFPIYQIVSPEVTAESVVRNGANTDISDTPYPIHYSIRKTSSGYWKFRRF